VISLKKSGNYVPSFCSNLLESSDPKKQTEEFIFDLKWSANSMYSASIDTVSLLLSKLGFFPNNFV
jgi:hypothetical protein